MWEANRRQHEVKQEEDFNDGGVKVGLSYMDHEGARCCAISGKLVCYVWPEFDGKNARGSDRLEQHGILMMKVMGG